MANHAQIAAACRANPGRWQYVSTHRSSQNAGNQVRAIQIGRGTKRASSYEPPGAYEACIHTCGDDYGVWARYIGPPLT
jgi:hypothetical protein